MKDTLWKLLEALNYPVYEQGSFTDTKDYPQHFFTIWNDDTPGEGSYDNKEFSYRWEFTIYFYSVSPLKTVEVLNEIKKILQEKGWIVPGKGKDAYSDSVDHSGRMIEAYYLEINKEED